jgi:glutathione peroxidase-family protein
MEKKTRGLTRVKRMHNWCVGVRWNFKRIIITREGVL